MTARHPEGGRPDPVGRVLARVSEAVAVLGGVVLTLLAVMSIYSILGRELAGRPMAGDFELVELGMAVAIFAFLPYCQMVRGNILVDFFTARAHPRLKAALAVVANLALTGLAGLLTWRLALGGLDLRQYAETTMVLRLPVWWGYVPAVLFMGLLTVVSAYTVARSLREALGAGEPATGAGWGAEIRALEPKPPAGEAGR